jgi:hypothetical protein
VRTQGIQSINKHQKRQNGVHRPIPDPKDNTSQKALTSYNGNLLRYARVTVHPLEYHPQCGAHVDWRYFHLAVALEVSPFNPIR